MEPTDILKKILLLILEVLVLNPGSKAGNPERFRDFTRPLQGNSDTVP
jgi:hypothetical protein